MSIAFSATSRLLLIGDSITDCGRRDDAEQVGSGYVRLIRDWLTATDPSIAPIVINRGISGSKIPDLEKRWQRDVLDERPDVLSIYIGINDVWHGLAPGRAGCDIDDYVRGYRSILKQTRETLPSCRVILCEPSVIWPPAPAEGNERLAPYVRAVQELSAEFAAECVVPLHTAFHAARDARPDIPWTRDGVHPTSFGHTLIARTWLDAASLI